MRVVQPVQLCGPLFPETWLWVALILFFILATLWVLTRNGHTTPGGRR